MVLMSGDRCFRPSTPLAFHSLADENGPRYHTSLWSLPQTHNPVHKAEQNRCLRHCILWALRALCSHVEAAIWDTSPFERAIFHPHLFPVTLDPMKPTTVKRCQKASLLLLTVLAQEVRNVEVSHQRKSEWPSPEIFIEASFSILEPRRNTNQ